MMTAIQGVYVIMIVFGLCVFDVVSCSVDNNGGVHEEEVAKQSGSDELYEESEARWSVCITVMVCV